MNHKHRKREGEQANTSRPRRRPEITVGAVAAMAGEAEVIGARS